MRFIELDAEKMGDFFAGQHGSFDAVWISEALSHFPNKPLFFSNAKRVLKTGGKLVLADWFKADNLDESTFVNDIKPIEGLDPLYKQTSVKLTSTDDMLLPPLCTQQGYVEMAKQAGLKVTTEPKDISNEVRQTWYASDQMHQHWY